MVACGPAPTLAPRIALGLTLPLLLLATVAEADEILTDDLEELAKWCAANKLYGARQNVYEALLVLDPDHAAARKGLKYRRGKDGAWERSTSFQPGRDFSKKKRTIFEKRRRAVAEANVKRIVAAPPTDHRALTAIVTLDADNEAAHSALGEVKVGSRWLLQETLRSRERRRELTALARECLRKAPVPRLGEATAADKEIALQWKASFKSRGCRLVATTHWKEAMTLCRLTDSCRVYFGRALNVDTLPIFAQLAFEALDLALQRRILEFEPVRLPLDQVGRTFSLIRLLLGQVGRTFSLICPLSCPVSRALGLRGLAS